jgi:carbonic anhydrase
LEFFIFTQKKTDMSKHPLSIEAKINDFLLKPSIFILFFLQSCGFAADVVTKDALQKMTPSQALQRLIDGNERVVKNRLKQYRLNDQRYYLGKKGAYPPAVILCGVDAKVAPELIFNQGLGDVHCLRAPASMVTPETIGAMEYACQYIGSKVIVVMAQTKDPFIESALDYNQQGNMAAIFFQIRPILENVKRDPNWKRWKREDFVNLLTREFLLVNTEKIRQMSPILRGMLERGEINLVSAVYNVETGKVGFYRGEE